MKNEKLPCKVQGGNGLFDVQKNLINLKASGLEVLF